MSEGKNYLKQFGMKVVGNGWPVVLLAHGQKKPLAKMVDGKPKGWLTIPGGRIDIVKKLLDKERRYGMGIVCGNVIGLDDDYEEGGAVTKEFMKAVAELKEHFFPEVLLRRGRETRPPLQVFRLEDDETYKSLNIAKFQIIASGRQFVAYNRHPETKTDYTWLRKGLGSPATTKFDDVPMYAKATLDDFVKGVLLLEETWGLAPERGADVLARIKEGDYTPGEIKGDRGQVERAAQYLENKAEWGWEEWNHHIMMPLWGASGGEDWGLDLAHVVSAQHESYDHDVTQERWERLSKSPPSRIGAGTVYWQARQNGMPFQGPVEWEVYRSFEDRTQVLNVKTGGWTERVMFNDVYHTQRDKGFTPLQTFIATKPHLHFQTMVWDPTLPHGEAVSDNGNKRVWNTCQMPAVPDEEGDVGPWLALMDNIYGNSAKMMIMRMAFDVQYPARKPQWHELIIGDHGIGKNLNKTPLRNWFGEMAMSLNASRLEENFSSFMVKKKHLEIVELSALSARTFNRHKDIFAGTDEWYEVNEKFLRPYKVRNIVSVPMSSNEIDAISISPTERRIYVVRHRGKSLPKPELYKLHAEWMPANWKKVVRYLHDKIKLPPGFADVLPEPTQDMKELVATAGRAHDKIRMQIRQATRGVEVFGLAELHHHFVEAGVAEKPGVIVTVETVRKALLAENAIRVREGQPIRLENDQRRLWSFNHDNASISIKEARTLWIVSDNFKQIVKD